MTEYRWSRKTWLIALVMALIAGLMVVVLPSLGGAASAAADIRINEIRIDQSGSDIDEFFELAGPAGTSLDDLTYIVIGDVAAAGGVIENVTDLTGNTIPASGFFVAAESSFTLGTEDLTASLNFENSDNVTHLLVDRFIGSNGDDLDTDDDGILDITPWTAIVDSVSLIESVGSGDPIYGATSVGPDGFFVPGHVIRCGSDFAIGPFSPVGFLDTPGAVNPCPPGLTSIPDIQGSGQFSPVEGQLVRTTGVVTLYSGNGHDFWLQDPAGDGNPATSDGILVDDGGRLPNPPDVGDIVTLTAVVEEQQFGNALPLTRLDEPSILSIQSTGHPLPAPVVLNDLPNGPAPHTPPGTPLPDGEAFWEPLEGMRVQVRNGRVIAPTNQFGEFGMVTNRDKKKGSGYESKVKQLLLNSPAPNVVDYNPERIQVDDTATDTPEVRPGDKIGRLVGVVDYTFSMYKLQIDTIADVDTRPLPTVPVSRHGRGGHNLTITTFNVENLFDLIDTPGKDDIGTGGASTPAELETQLTKLALAIELELRLPEIIVVQEIENTAIAQELADRINSSAGTDYVATSFETSDGRGIEPGFLWDANRVDLSSSFQFNDVDQPGTETAFGPTSPSPGREPIVGEFDLNGDGSGDLTIVGNHFKSKGGDDPPYGVQFVRGTEVQRKAQAQVVRDFVDTILDADPNAFVVVAGDLNDFEFGEPGEGTDHPLGILEGVGGGVPLTNLVFSERREERFSFIFDSNSQVLDHILVSPTLLDAVRGADFLHFNAGFPASLGSDDTTPLRASDHDALEARFNLPKPTPRERTVDIQLLQYSDWHGAITDAPVLGAYLHQDEAANPNTIILTGGDDFGGTEPVSSLNDDLPAILVQNAFGTDVAGLGNHNFDGGIANLQQKINLADYTYISANLANVDDNVTGVQPYVIFDFNPQIKVAVIGYTNEEAPILVFPGNFGTIVITDAAAALQAARDQAEADGADIFVAIGHKGVRSFDGDGNPQGELIDLANALEGFDVILGDHTDVEFTGVINGAIVAEAQSNGDSYNRITLTVKPGSGKIVATLVESIVADPAGITPDAEIIALTQPFFDGLAAAFDGVIGQSGGFWQRASSAYERIGEAELGNLFADAMLASAPGSDIAFTNGGGIRSTLSPSNYTVTDPAVDRDLSFPDDIVVGDLFSLHNFGNIVTTQNVTGAQLHAAVEHGLSVLPAGRYPQIAGFQVIYDSSLAVGSRVLSITLDDGTPVADSLAQTFVMATTNFLSSGGDGYVVLNDPDAATLGLLTDAIGDYITSQGLVTPFFDCRMVDENPAGPATTRFDNPLGPFATRPDCP